VNIFCPKCDKENSSDAKFCGSCGTSIAALNTFSPAAVQKSPTSEQMTFGKSISTCMGKYADFNGRASRPEYWWFFLFNVILTWGALILGLGNIAFFVAIALWLPNIGVTARRLHDTNRSGWWMLISLTIIGLIPFYVWLASKGDDKSNEYGSPV